MSKQRYSQSWHGRLSSRTRLRLTTKVNPSVACWLYLCSTAEDDFITLRQQCFNPLRRKLHPFWQWLTIYLDLYQAVLDRDQARFDELMRDREEGYVARSLNKNAGESRPEFGGGEQSQFVFDFMGVGIAKVACRRGMRCDFDSTFLPKKVVDS